MNTTILEKVNQLPVEKQQEVEDFVEYLLGKYVVTDIESIVEKRKKNMGWAKDKIWMADDFNDTPEDFKDYL